MGSNFVGRHPRNYTNEPSAWNSQLAYFDAMRLARHAKHGLQRVERTGADVAKNHAKGRQAQCWRLEAG